MKTTITKPVHFNYPIILNGETDEAIITAAVASEYDYNTMAECIMNILADTFHHFFEDAQNPTEAEIKAFVKQYS